MTTKEKYWLAGLLEGEGSFMPGPPSRPNCPIIACEMSDKDVIDRVADLFGVTYIYENVPDEETWSSTYKVRVKGTSAIKLMTIGGGLERRKPRIFSAGMNPPPKQFSCFEIACGVAPITKGDTVLKNLYRRAGGRGFGL